MTAAAQKNGPASAATDPGRGSNLPRKGKLMNAHTDTTRAAVAAMIKLPHANTGPDHDLADALSMLRVVMELMGDGRGFSAEFTADLGVVINAARERIEPVFELIDRMDLTDEYRAKRIADLIDGRA